MYLRSLELLGFKSFARKTELAFPRGVAAIVGPNGCGKSNVLDALRWVLGEQSAKALRGSEMSDVIFNGNERLGPVGLAEVSLTFTDCEAELGTAWNEVRVTRRVYRDGKSEYLLNNTACRLRDIQELFMDTGIGRSAYSVMEQGRIDQILSSRPEDRRAIFEEAAGITKYKTQRREALRKLEATEANLARLADVLAEVRRQLASLQRQAAKARRYQALHADLKLLETHGGHAQWSRLGEELAGCRHELDIARAGLAQAERDLVDAESVLAYRRAALERHDTRLETSRAQAAETKSRLQHAESRLVFNGERLAESHGRLERFRADLATAEETLRVLGEQLAQTTSQERDALARLAAGQEQQRTEEARLRDLRARRAAAESAAQAAARRALEADTKLNAARAELARAGAEREAANARRELLSREIETLSPALETAGARIAEARDALLVAEKTLAERRTAAADAEIAAVTAQRELTAVETEERAAGRLLAEKTSRLDALRRLAAEGEGLAAGARAALRGAGSPGVDKGRILGALGSSIEVEPRYIPAIEAALGAQLQAVLTRDEETAARLLDALSASKLGRATLAPLPAASGDERDGVSDEHQAMTGERQAMTDERQAMMGERQAMTDEPKAVTDEHQGLMDEHQGLMDEREAVSNEPEAVREVRDAVPALRVIRAEPAVVKLLARLLAGTFIVETLHVARTFQRARPGCAVATLAGEFLSRDGLWQGGRGASEGAGQSVLQRQAQIATLSKEVAAARKTQEALVGRREAAGSRLAVAGEAGRQARSRVHAAQTETSTLAAGVGPLEREERGLRARLEGFGRELADFEKRFQSLAEKANRLQAGLDEQAAAGERAGAEGAAAREQTEELRRQETALGEAVNELRVRVAAEGQRHAGLEREKGPIAARCRELEGFIASRRQEMDEYQRRIGQSAEEARALEGTIATARTELAAAETLVVELVRERAGTLVSIEDLELGLRTRRQQAGSLHERRAAEEVREAQLRLRQENLHERILNRYAVDLRLFHPDPAAYPAVLERRRAEGGAGKAEEAEETPAATGPETPRPVFRSTLSPEQLVAQLSERLEAIGAVNLDAIAEHDALEERHRFLETQDADLRKAESELRGIISRINATSRELFTETFEQVRRHFGEMFRELFGGGRADLTLADASDPLECGIDITARPPGKPAQSISLLSGGEKTMTAVALLFAIYQVKPSPFCVLDEMDAPLDDTNVGRFVRLLDRFAQASQFVVITHNKRTMARADALFGVTMEEPGISKVVAVRLARADEPGATPPLPGADEAAPRADAMVT